MALGMGFRRLGGILRQKGLQEPFEKGVNGFMAGEKNPSGEGWAGELVWF